MRRKILLSGAVLAAACAGARGGPSPLARRYQGGEILRYRIEGTHATQGIVNSTYRAHAVSTVVQKPGAPVVEEVQWVLSETNGKEIRLPASVLELRQLLSLDPGFRQSIPDLSRYEPALYGPITDLMTFYVDLQFAIRRRLRRPLDRIFEAYGKPASWADGRRVVVGYDCVDFDVSLAELDLPRRLATVLVRHLPPKRGCRDVPAPWMRKPVADGPNNWFQVTRQADGGFMAGAGRENFDAEIRLRLPTGVIESATMHNPVELRQRLCKDAALTDCGEPERVSILRTIALNLVSEGRSP